MSEVLMNMPNTFAVEATQPVHEINIRWKQATALVAGVLLTAACSGGGREGLVASDATASPTTTAELAAASKACGESIDLRANSADKKYGSPESILPSLSTPAKNGNETLLATDKAAATVRTQLTHDSRALGVFSAYFLETRKTQQLPNTATLGRANDLIKTYGTNPAVAEQSLINACNSLTFLKPETKFAVTRGQAMAVETVRDAKGIITGFKTETINATENLQGFVLDFNHDDKSLTDVQKAIYEKNSKLILITADGKIVVNQTFGPSSFEVTKNAPQTPVSIKTNGTKVITVKPTSKPGEAPAGSKQSDSQNQSNNGSAKANGGSSTTGDGGGVKVGEQGCGTGAANCGGGSGDTTGNQGPAGPGTGGGGSAPEAPAPAPAPAPEAPAPKPVPAPIPAPKPAPKPSPAPKPVPVPTPPAPAPIPTPAPKGTVPPCIPSEFTPCT